MAKTTTTPAAQPSPQRYHDAVTALKRRLIEDALRRCGGNRTAAAEELGLQRSYLYRLMKDLGVQAPPAKPRKRSEQAAA